MRTIKSHNLFLAAFLLIAINVEAQQSQEGETTGSTPQNVKPVDSDQPVNLEQTTSVDQASNPDGTATPNKDDENLKYTKFGNKSLVWLGYGMGAPGNGLDTPSTHLEVGLDLPFNERIKWGPYFQRVSANKSEAFAFPSTGYSEVRKYQVTSNILGVQSRVLLYDVWQGRFGFGFSQTNMEIKSASTNAPLPSSAVGYKKTFPIGIAAQAAIQRIWVLSSVNLAAEFGYNVTAANSNESFIEIYLAAVARFSIGSDPKGPILKPDQSRQEKTDTTNSESLNPTIGPAPEAQNSPSIEERPSGGSK